MELLSESVQLVTGNLRRRLLGQRAQLGLLFLFPEKVQLVERAGVLLAAWIVKRVRPGIRGVTA